MSQYSKIKFAWIAGHVHGDCLCHNDVSDIKGLRSFCAINMADMLHVSPCEEFTILLL